VPRIARVPDASHLHLNPDCSWLLADTTRKIFRRQLDHQKLFWTRNFRFKCELVARPLDMRPCISLFDSISLFLCLLPSISLLMFVSVCLSFPVFFTLFIFPFSRFVFLSLSDFVHLYTSFALLVSIFRSCLSFFSSLFFLSPPSTRLFS
jgi:hypothetical protein